MNVTHADNRGCCRISSLLLFTSGACILYLYGILLKWINYVPYTWAILTNLFWVFIYCFWGFWRLYSELILLHFNMWMICYWLNQRWYNLFACQLVTLVWYLSLIWPWSTVAFSRVKNLGLKPWMECDVSRTAFCVRFVLGLY